MLMLDRYRNSLRRVTSNGRFIPAIDGLRCIAIVSVIIFHMNIYVLAKSTAFDAGGAEESYLQNLAACGDYGVQLFFVISGLILGLPFAEHHLQGRPRVSLRAYFSRRLLRIEPPYIINLAVIFILLVVAKSESLAALVPHLGASLLYLHNLVYRQSSWINHAAWSLEVEVQFYLLAPLLAKMFAIRAPALRRGVMLGALGLCTASKFAFPHVFRTVPANVFSFLDFFLAGLFLAEVYTTIWKSHPSPTRAWDVAAAGAWLAVIAVHFYRPAEPLLAAVILLACAASFRGKLIHGCLSSAWVTTIGGMCYTIYLYHQFIMSAVGRWTIGLSAGSSYGANLLVQLLLVVPPMLVASSVLFLLFEKPFMVRDWPRRWKNAIVSVVNTRRSPATKGAARASHRVGRAPAAASKSNR